MKTRQNKFANLENVYDVIVIKEYSSPKIVFIASQTTTKATETHGVPKNVYILYPLVTRICYTMLTRTILRCQVLLLARWCTSPFHRDVRNLDKNMQNRWLGGRGTVEYPSSLPDLTPE